MSEKDVLRAWGLSDKEAQRIKDDVEFIDAIYFDEAARVEAVRKLHPFACFVLGFRRGLLFGGPPRIRVRGPIRGDSGLEVPRIGGKS